MWPLPLPADYAKQIESNVADIKNIGGNHGGALTAGLILKEFVDDAICWAHLDIAGPARPSPTTPRSPRAAPASECAP